MKKRPTNLKLKAAIVEAGKTLTDVANELSTTKHALSRKIHGHYWFNEYEILTISKYLRRPVTDIFFGEEVTETITQKAQ